MIKNTIQFIIHVVNAIKADIVSKHQMNNASWSSKSIRGLLCMYCCLQTNMMNIDEPSDSYKETTCCYFYATV